MHMAIFHRVRGASVALWHAAERALKKGLRRQTDARPLANGQEGRTAFVHALDEILNRNRRLRQAAAALVFEIDDFRKIEEIYDRCATEQIIETAGDRVACLLREGDTLVRMEGPRFGIALSPLRRLDLEATIQLSTRIQHAMADPVQLDTGHIYISVSVGFALASRLDAPNSVELARAANVAQFEAMRDGPNAIRSYSAAMHDRMMSHNGLFDEAKTALENKEISAFFQPQIDLMTGQISGIEALARWHHPKRGIIAPNDFLPLMEKNGLMAQLGHLMLSEALRAISAWDRMNTRVPTVSINMSNAELRNPYLVDHIMMELDKFELSADRLIIEVLETVIASKSEKTIQTNLCRLAEMGCGIDLDDFGTGYASITSIRELAIQRIKIDRSFVTHIDRDEEQQNMVAAILTMADRLNLDTLAEGVETPQEQDQLTAMGCRHMQGFALARPASFREISSWIETFDPINARADNRRIAR